jgi:DNA-directed RNA polymerase subunit RPC12/RpoP
MGSDRLFNSHKFNRVVIVALLVWIASAALGIYLLTRFDALIHGQLYDFGLWFDHAWADAYYSYMQLMYVALGVPIALSFVSILIGFKSIKEKIPTPTLKPKLAQPQPQTAPPLKPKLNQPQPQPKPVVRQELKAQVKENTPATGITCPSCGKVFSRPLVMLNYENGKKKLVNVCPYCSYTLGNAENKQTSKSDFQIADADKKLTH